MPADTNGLTVVVAEEVLAPARNDRRSAGKTTALSAGFDVSRHAGAVVGAER